MTRTTEQMIQWMEQSILQGKELGHNTDPIEEVISKIKAADEMKDSMRSLARQIYSVNGEGADRIADSILEEIEAYENPKVTTPAPENIP